MIIPTSLLRFSAVFVWSAVLVNGRPADAADVRVPAVVLGPPRMTATTGPTTKPWVADFPAFANAFGQRHWVVGRSTRPCVSEKEAFELARSAATSQVVELLRPQVSSGRMYGDGESWLRSRVRREMSLGSMITDRSVARVHRPYGDVWSAAVLVDASGDRLAPIVREYESWQRGREVSARQTAGSMFGLAAAILAIYAVMNWATKGYFRGRLRAGAALAIGLGAVWLVHLARAAG